MARRDYPVTGLGVHPGELQAGLAGLQEAVAVHTDSVARPMLVPRDDVRQHLVELRADELVIARISDQSANCFEQPERGVNRVVLWRLAGVREAIGQHAAI